MSTRAQLRILGAWQQFSHNNNCPEHLKKLPNTVQKRCRTISIREMVPDVMIVVLATSFPCFYSGKMETLGCVFKARRGDVAPVFT